MRRTARAPILVLALAVGLALAAPLARAELIHVPVAEPTEAGHWYGTWYFGSRDAKIAIWIRRDDSGPEVRLRYLSMANGEGFETDWQGRAEYFHAGWPGTFRIELPERGDATMSGTWYWKLDRQDGARIEQGQVELFRVEDGRDLVLRFTDFFRVLVDGDREHRLALDHTLTFHKASNRLARWDELPF